MTSPAVVSYIPAIHKGYVDFFKKYGGGTLYVLAEELVREVPRMERDIRALTAGEIQSLLDGLNIFDEIIVLDRAALPGLQNGTRQIVMPDEDVNRHFAAEYLAGKNVEFISVFLRWDKQISTKETEVLPLSLIHI